MTGTGPSPTPLLLLTVPTATLLLLLRPLPLLPARQATVAAYQVLTRPSASCAGTAFMQPPVCMLPRVCTAQNRHHRSAQHSTATAHCSAMQH
jgi:hypothetical protein